MSRTDKDTPLWVRVQRPEEDRIEVHRCSTSARRYRWNPDGCDIDSPATPHDRRSRLCYWELASTQRWRWTWIPTRRTQHIYWWKPDRAMSKQILHDLARSYAGDVEDLNDDAVRTDQHRHQDRPGGGWWD